jgi:chemotaxis-related protein WspD
MTALPMTTDRSDCWHRIGVWGDGSCPDLAAAVHCHNCPVFSAAGRRFLASTPPPGYLETWTARLAEKQDERSTEVQGVLLFRLGDEWLALAVSALREVIPLRPIHRIPFRGGLLAGVVNVRGELHLSIRMDHLLGIAHRSEAEEKRSGNAVPRLLVAGRGDDTWVFRVDEVDRVHRLALSELKPTPPTLSRAATRCTRGVFGCRDRAVGLLDEERLFEVVRTSLK